MRKYLQIIKITFEHIFVYRVNFLLWRLRAFTTIIVLYFLWRALIPEGVSVFGYNQARILTYILGTSIIRSLVLTSRAGGVAGIIARGDLSNFLLLPISFLKYWFARDLGGKIANLFFSIFEISFIFWLLKPPLIIQSDPRIIIFTAVAIIVAMPLYFFISFLLSLIAFWAPENPWAPRFLFGIITGFLAGRLFPLDILPPVLFNFLKLMPFTYLLFFPLDVYLGKLSTLQIVSGLSISVFWLVAFSFLVRVVYQKGLRVYAAWGR